MNDHQISLEDWVGMGLDAPRWRIYGRTDVMNTSTLSWREHSGHQPTRYSLYATTKPAHNSFRYAPIGMYETVGKLYLTVAKLMLYGATSGGRHRPIRHYWFSSDDL